VAAVVLGAAQWHGLYPVICCRVQIATQGANESMMAEGQRG